MQTVFKVRVSSGEDLALAFNQTSINYLIDAYGEDSEEWKGKRVKVWAVMSNVGGKMKKVAYLTAPDQLIDGAESDEDDTASGEGGEDVGSPL